MNLIQKRTWIAAVFLALAPVLGVWGAISGTGTSANPYLIANETDLATFRDAVNGGDSYAGKYVKLAADITFSGTWTPIGTTANPFSGVFDGDGHAISGLVLSGPVSGTQLGFFGVVSGTANADYATIGDVWVNGAFNEANVVEAKYTAVVKNLVLANVNVSNSSTSGSTRYTGALAGQVKNAYVANIVVSGSVSGTKGVGGITGCLDGSVAKCCTNSATIVANGYNVGGIAGGANYCNSLVASAFIDCANSGSVTTTAAGGYAGGIVGMAQGGTGKCDIITGCSNSGTIHSVGASSGVGGIAGQGIALKVISDCSNSGTITSEANVTCVGGIAGTSTSEVYDSANYADITVSADYLCGIYTFDRSNAGVGGLINGCVNEGTLTNTSTNPAAQTHQLAANSNAAVYSNQTYANVAEVNAVIAAAAGHNSIEFQNCTVTDKSGTLILNSGLNTVISDTQLCTAVDVSTGNASSLTVNIPNVSVTAAANYAGNLNVLGANNTVTVNAGVTVANLFVSGNGSTVTNNGTVTYLGLGGSGAVTAVNNGTIGKVGFDAGTYTVDNNGTISHTQSAANAVNNEHTVSTIKAATITINNYGTIESKKNANDACSYALLFYNGSTAVINCFDGSLISCENSGMLLACSTANSVTFNVQEGASFQQGGTEAAPVTHGNIVVQAMVSSVAQIGTVKYASLASAISAAQTGDTIELLADIDLGTAGLMIDAAKNFTLDIGEYDITGTVNGKLITNNGTIVVNGTTGCIYNHDISAQGHDAFLNNGTATINGGWFGDSDNVKTNANAINRGASFRNFGTATINGGHFTACDNYTNGGYAYAIINGDEDENPTLTINDADVYGRNNGNIANNCGMVTVNGGTYDLSGASSYQSVYAYSGSTVVTNGTFTKSGNDRDQFWVEIDSDNADNPGTIAVSGGSFTRLVPEQYCAEGFIPGEQDPETGLYTVKPGAYVAQIVTDNGATTNKYASLADAIAAVPANGTATTIQMIADEAIEVSGYALTIPANKNVVLDLNGHEVVGQCAGGSNSALIRNLGTLTIMDGKDTEANGTGGGKLIGGADSTWTWDGSDDYSGSYASNLILNQGTLTVNSGWLENVSSGSAAYAIDNSSSGANAIVTVNGGVVKGTETAIRMFCNSTTCENTLNQNGGEIVGGYAGLWIQLPGSDSTKSVKASLNITGGKMKSESASGYAFYDYSYGNAFGNVSYDIDGGEFTGYVYTYGAAMDVSGGTFNSKIYDNGGDLTISGGTFNRGFSVSGGGSASVIGGSFATAIPEEYCADGYIPTFDSDTGYYTVKQGVVVAQILGKEYARLSAPIAEASDDVYIDILTMWGRDSMVDENGNACPRYIPITDETLYGNSGGPYNISAKYAYDTYFAPGMSWYSYQTTSYLYVETDVVVVQAKYESLAEAIAAVSADGKETTIQMIADSAETTSSTIAAGKNVVLDLNGKTVSLANASTLITNNGTLTIQDSSENDTGLLLLTSGVGAQSMTVYNLGGTLTLASGKIENTSGGLAYAVNDAVNHGQVSTFNMTGGTVSAPNGDAALRVYNNRSFSVTADCKNYVNISGGTILDSGIFVDTYLGSTYTANYATSNTVVAIEISGGTVNGLIDMKLRHPYNTSLNITGGTFGDSHFIVRKYTPEWNENVPEPTEPIVTISGGQFTFRTSGANFAQPLQMGRPSEHKFTTYDKAYAVSGGVFTVAVPEAFCAEGYVPTDNTDAETATAYPYTVMAAPNYVAQIVTDNGLTTNKYASLADAIAAVPANGTEMTIAMLADEAVVSGVTIAAGQNIVLELNGKTISGNTDSTSTYALITNRGTLTIQDNTDTNCDGTGTGLITTYITNPDTGDVPGYASNTISNYGNLTVKSGKIVNNGSGYACYAIDNLANGSGNTILNIEGGRMQQMNAYTYAVRLMCNSTTYTNIANVSGGVIEGGYALWVQTPNANANKAALNISGGTLNARDGAALYVGGTKADNSNISIGISGGEINGTGVIIQGPLTGTYGNVEITGGKIEKVLCGANVEEFISGGVFHSEVPEAYCAPGYIPVQNPETGFYSVVQGTYVAQIATGATTNKYASLAAAIAAVPTDGTTNTITMIADSAETAGSTVAAGKNIVLDLNGKAITCTGSFPAAFNLVAVNGVLTVTDTSADADGSIAIESTANLSWDYAVNLFLIGDGGSLTIENGNYSVSTPGYGYAEYVIAASNNSGSSDVTVNGGTFTGNNIDAVVRLHDQYGRCQPLNVTVNGGDFTLNGGSDSVIWFDVQKSGSGADNTSAASLVINGGTFTSMNASPALDLGHSVDASGLRVTIAGGAFKSNGAVIKTRELSAAAIANIQLSGGIYSGDEYYNDLTKSTAKLDTLCAEGCAVTDNTDAETAAAYPYTVIVAPNYVAQIVTDNGLTTNKYASLADAIAAVSADGTETTVTMIADVDVDDSATLATIPAGKNVVLDLNGKAITCTGSFPAAFNLIAVNGGLTVTDTSAEADGSIAIESTANLSWDYTVNMFLVGNGGSLTIEKGDYSVTTPSYGWAEYVIAVSNNSGSSTVTVNGGTFTGNNIDAVVRLHDQYGRSQPLNVMVNGGDFTLNGGSDSVIWFDVQKSGSGADNTSAASLVINGGTFTSMNASPALDLGHSVDASGLRVTIAGGAFKSNGAVIKTRELSAAAIANIQLSGGIYSGDEYYNDLTKSMAKLDTLCAEGCAVTDNADAETAAAYPYTVVNSTTYEITWVSEGEVLATNTIFANTVPVYSGETPRKSQDEQYLYVFSGWTPAIEAAVSNTTYTATFTAVETCEIRWTAGGNVVKSVTVTNGTPAAAIAAMAPANPGFGTDPDPLVYHNVRFLGWNPDSYVDATTDAEYAAVLVEITHIAGIKPGTLRFTSIKASGGNVAVTFEYQPTTGVTDAFRLIYKTALDSTETFVSDKANVTVLNGDENSWTVVAELPLPAGCEAKAFFTGVDFTELEQENP